MEISVILGIGIMAGFILYLAMRIQTKDTEADWFIKMLFLAFFFILILMIPEYIYLNRSHCEFLVVNSTDYLNSSSYVYDYRCVYDDSQFPLRLFSFSRFILQVLPWIIFFIILRKIMLNWVLDFVRKRFKKQ